MSQSLLKSKTVSPQINILIVDDEAQIRKMLRQMIEKHGYFCMTASNGKEAIEKIKTQSVDIVITDIQMPEMTGIELMQQARKYSADIHFIVITGYVKDFTYERIIEEGANDFIYKPMSSNELILRLKRVIRECLLMRERNRINEELGKNVQKLQLYTEDLNQALSELEKTHTALHSAYIDTIDRLVIASEYKDEDTGDHIIRMSRYCELLARKAGLSDDAVKNIRYASPMHDIGKIGIPDSILLKPGKLTDQEFDIIKTHTIIGGKILAKSNAEVLRIACDIALTHHEKWNGKGYPNGLQKEQIPIFGRIVGISDVFDALTSNRPYKKAYPVEVACEIIKKERENHFDPDLTDIFLVHIDEFIDIKNSVGTIESLSIDDFQWSERDRNSGMDQSALTIP